MNTPTPLVGPLLKECTKCGITAPAPGEFARDRRRKDGFFPWCNSCQYANQKNWRAKNYEKVVAQERARAEKRRLNGNARASRLKYWYKIDPAEFDRLRDAAGSVCRICKRSDQKLVFDHCHSTGVFRAFICGTCNRTLGFMRDDPAALRRAADYLEGKL